MDWGGGLAFCRFLSTPKTLYLVHFWATFWPVGFQQAKIFSIVFEKTEYGYIEKIGGVDFAEVHINRLVFSRFGRHFQYPTYEGLDIEVIFQIRPLHHQCSSTEVSDLV